MILKKVLTPGKISFLGRGILLGVSKWKILGDFLPLDKNLVCLKGLFKPVAKLVGVF